MWKTSRIFYNGAQKNPITAENACGLARIVRSMIIPSYENALLWHERDLANSSAERFTLSHSMILLDDIIIKCNKVMKNLVVDNQRMRENIDLQQGLIMAEKVMLVLVEQGMSREDSHEILRSCSMKAIDENMNLFDVCAERNEIIDKIDLETLKEVFKPESHLGFSDSIVELTVKRTREYLN